MTRPGAREPRPTDRFEVMPIFERDGERRAHSTGGDARGSGATIQSGDVNLYLFYLFVVVVIAYAVFAS